MEGWSEVPVEVGLWRVDGNKPVKVTPSVEPPTTNPGIDTKSQVIALTGAATSNVTINRCQPA